MLSSAILAASLLIRIGILFCAFQGRIFKEYRWFYSYVISTVLADAMISAARLEGRGMYTKVYWVCQFGTLAIGCGVVLEIFKHVLSAYPGAERFARTVCLLTFGGIFLFGLIYPLNHPSGIQAVSIELERDVRSAQILFLVAIIAVISYYSIPLGRNMLGMICGYALYLGISMLSLAFRVYIGRQFATIWHIAQPLGFDISLLIWLVALWGYYPSPAPRYGLPLESDYEAVAAFTKARVNALRSHLGRSIRE